MINSIVSPLLRNSSTDLRHFQIASALRRDGFAVHRYTRVNGGGQMLLIEPDNQMPILFTNVQHGPIETLSRASDTSEHLQPRQTGGQIDG